MAHSSLLMWAIALIGLFQSVYGLASTDTITWGGDNSRSGYQDNHNMDPTIVGSPQFGQLFKTKLPGNYKGLGAEQVFSQPLVYTLSSSGKQYVYVLTTQNNLYQLDAKTGAIVNSRELHVPFLTSDLDGCVDINPTIGVTGTGVIDPETETLYFVAKTYKQGFTSGRLNGEMLFHAVDVNTLNERPGFPTSLEGAIFRNNPNRMFLSGNQHQRTGLLHTGQYIYAGFASHCVQYNFTGAILGWDKTTGKLVETFATQGGNEPNTVKGGGVWMSGGGLAYEAGSMYFATGNGYASQLKNIPVQGRTPPTALEEAAVNARVNEDGTITPIDFFMPWEKQELDGADKDLGTSPLQILPSSTFSCPNAKRIGIVTGKSGKTYWLNLDNLGGYQMGPNQFDAVPQQFLNENSVYAGAGVMPLDGGYVYINVIKYKTHVWKFGCNADGNIAFTHVADTVEQNANILGVGHGTTTSLRGQADSGLLWTSDVEGLNLRIYKSKPNDQGSLTMINSFNVPGSMKFGRPVFGDAMCYVASNQGFIYGFGAPVDLPLDCTAPPSFGEVNIGETSASQKVTCRANIQTTITGVDIIGNPNFVFSNVPTLPLNLNKDATFSFDAAFRPKQVGSLSSSALVNTTNSIAKYAINTPVKLTGTGVSQVPLLLVSPNTVSFSGIITGQITGGVNQSATIINQGSAPLHISKLEFSTKSETGPFVAPVTTANGASSVGPFTFFNLPSTIGPKTTAVVPINFNPSSNGNFAVFMAVTSDGGNGVLDVLGTSSTTPKVQIEFQSIDGKSWVNYTSGVDFDFGDVVQGTTVTRKLRLTNIGGPNAASLSITVSKPPYGVSGIVGAANNVDLAEGTTLAAGESQTADLYCASPKSQVNMPAVHGSATWTINTGDPVLGKQFIQFTCNAVSQQYGPTFANGSSLFQYSGCARENNPGRQLPKMQWGGIQTNTNGACIKACANDGYAIAGTQYNTECWCGNMLPKLFTKDADCNYPCSGNINEVCGGNGELHVGGPFITVFSTSAALPYVDGGNGNGNGGGGGGGGGNGGGQGGATIKPVIPPSVGNFSYVGCFSEAKQGRALTGKDRADDTTTLDSCMTLCKAFKYFGTEYGRECYCGNSPNAGSSMDGIAQTDCNMPCAGNSSQVCGAGNRLTMFAFNQTLADGVVAPSSSSTSSATSSAASSSSAATSVSTSSAATTATTTTTTTTSSSATPTQTGPLAVQRAGTFAYSGCVTEATGTRALSEKTFANDTLTVDMCASFCTGFAMMGVEYGRECYCGTAQNTGSVTAKEDDCNMLCAGDKLQYCGAGNRLNLYTLAPSSSSTSVSSTARPTSTSSTSSSVSASSSASTSSSVSTSSSASTRSSVSITSTSASSQTSSAASTSSTATSSATSSPTSTSASSTVSITTSSVATSSTSTSTTSTRSTSTSSTTSSAATTTTSAAVTTTSSSTKVTTSTTTTSSSSSGPTVSGYAYQGCYTEATNGRALSAKSFNYVGMTIESCAANCTAYAYFGVEYGRECYCGATLSADSEKTTGGDGPNGACRMACSGNKDQTCGDGGKLSLYYSTAAGKLRGPPQIVDGDENYAYYGCVGEPANGRALGGGGFYANDTLTVSQCLEWAAGRGFRYAGLEYSRECWAANTLSTQAVNKTAAACSNRCGGNQQTFCGGPGALSLYVTNSTAIWPGTA